MDGSGRPIEPGTPSADDVDGSQGLLAAAEQDDSPTGGVEDVVGGQRLILTGHLDVVDVGAAVLDRTAGLALRLDDSGGDDSGGGDSPTASFGARVTGPQRFDRDEFAEPGAASEPRSAASRSIQNKVI